MTAIPGRLGLAKDGLARCYSVLNAELRLFALEEPGNTPLSAGSNSGAAWSKAYSST